MPVISPTLVLILAFVAVLAAGITGWWVIVERPSRRADAAIEPDYEPRHREPGSLESEAAAADTWSEDWTDELLERMHEPVKPFDLDDCEYMSGCLNSAACLASDRCLQPEFDRRPPAPDDTAAWPDVLFDGPAALDQWLSGRPLAATPWLDR